MIAPWYFPLAILCGMSAAALAAGAMVGRQPFGGFDMSGGGTKAGGPGYLQQFAQPRSVCENTERRGFVPGVEA